MKKKKLLISSAVTLVAAGVIGGLAWGTDYLFNYAIVRGEKDFLSPSEASGQVSGKKSTWTFATTEPAELSMKSVDGLDLMGLHFKQDQPAKPKLAVIVHGYTSSGIEMSSYAEMFYELGYDLLIPDARAHGHSEGEYIGFGWPDRLDLIKWLNQTIDTYNGEVDVVLFGVSMGASTVLMASGEKLPEQVKAIVEDCGYDTVENELAYQLNEMFNLPAFPLVSLTSVYTEFKAGYNFKEASAVKQVAKNKLPTLFIHGEEDGFVPTEMVYKLYEETKGPKELYLVPGAKHAESFKVDQEKYREIVSSFLTTYI